MARGPAVLAGALAYANSLSGPFIFDDQATIFDNAQIRSLRPSSVFFPSRELPVAGRPVVNLSFAINYALGGQHVVGYHVWNVAVHLRCGLLIFGLVRRTLESPRLRDAFGERAVDLGFATALIWTLHP
ncbi:MAG: hypothetical protein HY047_05790 [Acidobacteria bacterium]|nr:hypothetical protein [Acidobacteriota bacterium]